MVLRQHLYLAAVTAGLFLVGVDGQVSAQTATSGAEDAVQRAVDAADRSAADRERDPNRKPADVLSFFGVEPGMTVLDVLSGGGYYTEIVSRVVGPKGHVIAHNNQGYLGFVGDEIKARYAGGRLANVEQYQAEANDIDIAENSVDVALLILGYHDIYYRPTENPETWPKIDEKLFLANIFRAVKPGGVLGIVDHRPPPGSPAETGNTLHRIDPEIVKAGATAAGFVYEGEATFLVNPDDPHDIPMYDPSIRGRTDRFVHRYRKPLS